MATTDYPNTFKLSWSARLRLYSESILFAKAILDAFDGITATRLAIAYEAGLFVQRAQDERKAQRQEIVARHQRIHGSNAKVETSYNVLMLPDRLDAFELIWREIWYQRWDGHGPKPKPRYNAIPCKAASGTDMRRVLKGAHPDEVELLTSHELEARRFRNLWAKTTKVSLALAALGKVALKMLEHVDEESGDRD